MGLLPRGTRAERDREFVAFYTSRAEQLRATAYLLCGDWHLAEDLVQNALIKLYRVWTRIERRDTMDRYARSVLLRVFLDNRRRPWRREQPTLPDSELLDGTGATARSPVEDRLVLRDALMRLTDRQRAVLVLRYWMDLPVEQVADLMDCSQGTVKSQTARAQARLRELLADVWTGSVRHPGGES